MRVSKQFTPNHMTAHYAFYDASTSAIDIVPNGKNYRSVGINKTHEAAKVMREWMTAGMITCGIIRAIDGAYWNENMNLTGHTTTP